MSSMYRPVGAAAVPSNSSVAGYQKALALEKAGVMLGLVTGVAPVTCMMNT